MATVHSQPLFYSYTQIECNFFISHIDQVIQLIEAGVDPEGVCEKLGLCSKGCAWQSASVACNFDTDCAAWSTANCGHALTEQYCRQDNHFCKFMA